MKRTQIYFYQRKYVDTGLVSIFSLVYNKCLRELKTQSSCDGLTNVELLKSESTSQ